MLSKKESPTKSSIFVPKSSDHAASPEHIGDGRSAGHDTKDAKNLGFRNTGVVPVSLGIGSCGGVSVDHFRQLIILIID